MAGSIRNACSSASVAHTLSIYSRVPITAPCGKTLQELTEVFFTAIQFPRMRTKANTRFLQQCLTNMARKSRLEASSETITTLVRLLLKTKGNDLSQLTDSAGIVMTLSSLIHGLQKHISKASALGKRLDSVLEQLCVKKVWFDLGLDPSVLKTDFEGVRFLVKERLIYSIVGLQNTSSCGANQLHIESGKIYILCEGKFVPVSSLLGRFHYAKDDLQSREANTNLAWNYLLPDGLVQVDRCESPSLLPTTQLSSTEMNQLLQHASFFPGLKFSKENPPVGVLQIVTNPRKKIKKDFFLFHGIEAQAPVHVGFRFIDAKGRVYSSGFASTVEEDAYCTGKRNFLASINGMPGITDYEEFRSHEGRRVTSVPLTKEACTNLMGELQKMRTQGVRFNILTQNCARMASRALEIVGVPIDHIETSYEFIAHLLPSFTSFPKLHYLIGRIFVVSQIISQLTLIPSLEEGINLSKKVIFVLLTPLRIITNLVLNLLLMIYGAHKGSPLKAKMYGERPQDGMKKFFAIISSPWDLFSTTTLYHSGPIIAWQDRQTTTRFYTYSKPSMNILPDSGKAVPASKGIPYARYTDQVERAERIGVLGAKRRRVFRIA